MMLGDTASSTPASQGIISTAPVTTVPNTIGDSLREIFFAPCAIVGASGGGLASILPCVGIGLIVWGGLAWMLFSSGRNK